MKSVREIAREIVAREGGFVDDPDDPGGATKHGVTIQTMRALRRDLTGDGRVDVADVRALAPDTAAEIFVEHYWRRPGLDRLPGAIQPSVFDMYVNAGANAVKILQRLLLQSGHEVAADGVIGPVTLAAAWVEDARGAQAFADAYGVARRDYYYAIADARPASRKYARARDGGKGGWIRRAEEFISPALHLSDAAHRARVASWG